MASNRRMFRQATTHWQELHDAGQYSLDIDDGYVAIVSSDFEYVTRKEPEGFQRSAFRQDALAVSQFIQSHLGLNTLVIKDVDREKILGVLTDRLVSSIVTIGNGVLSSLYVDDDSGGNIDWQFIASNTDHLKRGFFQQRQCGLLAYDLSVPLGTFALSRQRSVFAAAGKTLPTKLAVLDPRIRRLHDREVLSYNDVKQLFPKMEPTVYTDYDLPATATSATATSTRGSAAR